MIDRFRRSSIRMQFVAVASIIIPVIVICIITILPEPFIFYNERMLVEKRAQIELIVTQLRNSGENPDFDRVVMLTAPNDLQIEVVPWSHISQLKQSEEDHYEGDRFGDDHFISESLSNILPADFNAIVLRNLPSGEGYRGIAVRLDPLRGLIVRFRGAEQYPSFSMMVVEFVAKVSILMMPMLILVLYIGRMITSPLVRFANAAKSLRLDDNEEELFVADGARELHTLATSLNNMRQRIRKMVDDRTRMLTAVSHDLRTPLTRLQMRVERSADSGSKTAMLADIATLTSMIEESLQYLSSNAAAEQLRKVDISSLLQTIATDFCDLGHAVSYGGPERFGYLCKQKALVRAITNVVENACRFGSTVLIDLRTNPRGETKIIVSDDGPGLEEGLHDKVLEPFFKADQARTSNANSGFGLGLSIADEIVKGHGGTLSLENIAPHGLQVTIRLPPAQVVHRAGQVAPMEGKALSRKAISREEAQENGKRWAFNPFIRQG